MNYIRRHLQTVSVYLEEGGLILYITFIVKPSNSAPGILMETYETTFSGPI